MARVGRKRKVAKREPNGRVQRTHEKLGPTPEWFERRCEAVGANDALRWDGTIIGALVLKGVLDESHQVAAVRYGALVRRYLRALPQQPPKGAQAQNLNQVRGGEPDDMDCGDFADLYDRYQRAFEAIGGYAAKRAVTDALHERPVHSVDRLREGLDGLAQHFGL